MELKLCSICGEEFEGEYCPICDEMSTHAQRENCPNCICPNCKKDIEDNE